MSISSREAGMMMMHGDNKAKRLVTLMTMGFSYFEARKALEENDWNVEDAVASFDVKKPAPRETWRYSNENHHQPDRTNNTIIKSLKRPTPHSKPNDQSTASALDVETNSDSSHHQHHHFWDYYSSSYWDYSSSSLSTTRTEKASVKQQQQQHASEHDNTNDGVKDEKALGIMDDEFWNVPTISTPSALFREEIDDTASTAVESTSVPELVNAAALQEPSVVSAVTSPMELCATGVHSPPQVGDDDKSAVKKSNGQQQQRQRLTRRACVMIALATLVLVCLGLAMWLGVTHSRPNNNSNQSGVLPRGEESSVPPRPFTTFATSLSSTSQELPTTTAPTATTELPTTTLRPTGLPTDPPTSIEPTSPLDSTSAEGAEMVLAGISSRLDGDAMGAWIDVTNRFLLDHVQQILPSPYRVNVRLALNSQTENEDSLSIVFSVEFDIESNLESHNVNDYVLGAFRGDKKDAYIQELQDSDSSFQGVFDVSVSV